MRVEFKEGDKVVRIDPEGSYIDEIPVGTILTVKRYDDEWGEVFFYETDKYLFGRRLELVEDTLPDYKLPDELFNI